MKIEKIHHVAYRCRDAKQTVEWYRKNLNMDFVLAIAEDRVPSTKEPDPYMHVFLDAGGGNVLAFFELPTKPEMGRDPNTPEWVQHIAFKVKDRDTLLRFKAQLEANVGLNFRRSQRTPARRRVAIQITTCRVPTQSISGLARLHRFLGPDSLLSGPSALGLPETI